MDEAANAVQLEAWRGPWPDDDPDANFKADIAVHADLDVMEGVAAVREARRRQDDAIANQKKES